MMFTEQSNKARSSKLRSPVPQPIRILCHALVLGIVTFLLFNFHGHIRDLFSGRIPESRSAPIDLLGADELDAIAQVVASQLGSVQGGSVNRHGAHISSLKKCSAYVCLRANGLALAEAWGEEGTPLASLADATARARERLDAGRLALVDAAEIDLAYNFKQISRRSDRELLSDAYRGVYGIQITRGLETQRWAPTTLIAENRSFKKILRALEQDRSPVPYRLSIFNAQQLLVRLGAQPRSIPMFRGNQIVPLSDVSKENTETFARLMASWMFNQVGPDGRMVYKYWPSRGQESPSDNTIRQFMATICLRRAAEAFGGPRQLDSASQNLSYNLRRYYRSEGELGLIENAQKVKLGAVALAALAILESQTRSAYRDQERKLGNLVDYLFQTDGSFQTFYGAPDRKDNQNFYPGEALLLWASTFAETRDEALLEKFMRAYRYYRTWHRRHRNPAFIPWHTMAYFIVWRITGESELRDSIFEMNDWLLGRQQWEGPLFPDIQGRFYDTDHPEYGPPHVSSTGVYLDGLIDAFALARHLQDDERVESYRRGIVRGLRSLYQLQFVDDVDMFYVSKRDRVHGGLRTTVYRNEIRVDNVQHALMAVMKILAVFNHQDYRAGQQD